MSYKNFVDMWGFIPNFLDPDDPRPVAQQFDAKYMGGWHSFEKGFTFDGKRRILAYAGDPPMQPISVIQFRDETIYLFASDWVVIEQLDGAWDVARMD